MMAQEVALKGAANGRARSLLACTKSVERTGMQIGDAAPFYEAMNRKGALRWRGPAKILGVDDTGVTVEFQSQTFRVARYCVRKKVEEEDLGEGDWDPSRAYPRTLGLAPRENSTLRIERNEVEGEKEKADTSSSAGTPGGCPHTFPKAIPVPASPLLLVQVPSSPQPSVQLPAPESSSVRNCEQPQAPVVYRSRCDKLTWGQLK